VTAIIIALIGLKTQWASNVTLVLVVLLTTSALFL